VFLRRYATYCVRRKRYVQAEGAAALWQELMRASGLLPSYQLAHSATLGSN
jgi:hypothetical protein